MSHDPLDVRALAAERPEAIAWVVDGAELSYRTLAQAVSGRVEALGRTGAPGVVVAAPERATVEALLAHLAVGAPVLLVHPRWTPAERAARLAGLPLGSAAPTLEPAAPLAIVATSGTTGEPRWIALSRAAMVASARATEALLGAEAGDRWLLAMPLSHVSGLGILVRSLVTPAAVVLCPRGDARSLAAALQAHAPTLASLVPAQLAQLLDLGVPPGRLRAVLVGGAAASPALLERARRAGYPVLPTYGLSEAAGQVATARRDEVPDGAAVGPPLPFVQLRFVAGEICVRSPSLLSGYFPAGAAPLDADGYLPTGDLGHLDARGHLVVTGRRREILVSGGENVAPLEVERALESCPGVAAALVFGLADEIWGERVCAAIVPAAGFDRAALAAFVRTHLAPHARPRALALVAALPLTTAGKLDRRGAPALLGARLAPLD